VKFLTVATVAMYPHWVQDVKLRTVKSSIMRCRNGLMVLCVMGPLLFVTKVGKLDLKTGQNLPVTASAQPSVA
jgi:hypothetical protein